MVAWLYTACLLCLAIYGLNSLWLTFLYWLKPRKQNESQPIFALDYNLPIVTVQLPMFNERYVAERLLQAVSRLNYPRELLQISNTLLLFSVYSTSLTGACFLNCNHDQTPSPFPTIGKCC